VLFYLENIICRDTKLTIFSKNAQIARTANAQMVFLGGKTIENEVLL
jgi:hypothetical protein